MRQIQYFRSVRRKLLRAFAICLAIFYVLPVGFLLALATLKNDFEKFLPLEAWTLYAGGLSMAISTLIMALALATEYQEYSRFNRLLDRGFFKHLSQLGFVRTELFARSLWKLHYPCLATTVHEYGVLATLHTVDQLAFAVLASPARNRNVNLPSLLVDNLDVRIEHYGIALFIHSDSRNIRSTESLRMVLEQIADALREAGWAPSTDLRQFELKMKNELIMKALGGQG